MFTAPLSVDNKTIYSADGYCFKEWYWTLWGASRLRSSTLCWTDKSSLNFICWKERTFVRPQSCAHERRDAHKLGESSTWDLPLPESKSKSWEEFNSWKTWVPSSTSTATFIGWWKFPLPPMKVAVVEGISMATAYTTLAYHQSCYTSPDSQYHSRTFPMKKKSVSICYPDS